MVRVVNIFTTLPAVQIFLLAQNVLAENWSGEADAAGG
jgi:hypothetical protein